MIAYAVSKVPDLPTHYSWYGCLEIDLFRDSFVILNEVTRSVLHKDLSFQSATWTRHKWTASAITQGLFTLFTLFSTAFDGAKSLLSVLAVGCLVR